jgi:hypothetical protein
MESRGAEMTKRKSKGLRFIYLLLLPPYVALLWVASYDRLTPVLWGIPFFYWYQLLWIPLGALLLYPIYRAEEREASRRKDEP